MPIDVTERFNKLSSSIIITVVLPGIISVALAGWWTILGWASAFALSFAARKLNDPDEDLAGCLSMSLLLSISLVHVNYAIYSPYEYFFVWRPFSFFAVLIMSQAKVLDNLSTKILKKDREYHYVHTLRNIFSIIAATYFSSQLIGVLKDIFNYSFAETLFEKILLESWFYPATLGVYYVLTRLSGNKLSDWFRHDAATFDTGFKYFCLGLLMYSLPFNIVTGMFTALVQWFTQPTSLVVSYSVIILPLATRLLLVCTSFVTTMLQTFFEELLFRRFLFKVLVFTGFANNNMTKAEKTLENLLHQLAVILIMGSVFAGLHMLNIGPAGQIWAAPIDKFFSYLIDGVIWSALYIWTGGLEMSWAMHFCHNMSIHLLFFGAEGSSAVGYFQRHNILRVINVVASVFSSTVSMVTGLVSGYFLVNYFMPVKSSEVEVANDRAGPSKMGETIVEVSSPGIAL